MGRLFLSHLSALTLLMLFFTSACLAQEDYFVFKVSGEPMLNNSTLIKRGTVFMKPNMMNIKEQDTVFLINQLGELFELNVPNTYSIKSIENFRKKSNRSSLSIGYFSYVWKQFSNQKEIRQRPGVVYREDRTIKLSEPMDSIRFNVPAIEFSWKNNTDASRVYFHLQDLDNNHISKIGTDTSSIILYRDNVLLQSGRSYKWAVTAQAFPDFGKLDFNSFELLTKKEYEKLKTEMKTLEKALLVLGFSEEDIKTAICLDYKFCEG
ncbi:hypothetical protein [Maribacter sp. 4U21]|uniref:hypothetical protein n=1 Tax=Maribacter sp. 4U21 TaxID=1889779 RepID=UPI0011803B54|nr:hypothetical protein [Maribacter sp. 4U21]